MRNGSAKPSRPPARANGKRPPERRGQVGAWSDSLSRQTKEHPVRSVAFALGAGYVLGGGLFSPLTARIVGAAVRLGLRLAFVPLLTQSIVALGETVLDIPLPRRPDHEAR
jgi:hypothetical protein